MKRSWCDPGVHATSATPAADVPAVGLRGRIIKHAVLKRRTEGTTMSGQTNGDIAAKKSCSCCVPTASALELATDTDETGSPQLIGDADEVRVVVKGVYGPDSIRLTKGVPARLVFDRQETSRCSEQLLIPAFGVKQLLPANQETVIEFTP